MMLMMMMSMRLLNRVQLTKKTLILNLSLVTHIATNHFYNIYEYIFNVVYKFVDTKLKVSKLSAQSMMRQIERVL